MNQGREYKHHQRKNPSRCESIHYKHDHKSKQRVVGTQENPPSNIMKLQNIQRGRTNVELVATKYSQLRVQNIRTLNSYVENCQARSVRPLA